MLFLKNIPPNSSVLTPVVPIKPLLEAGAATQLVDKVPRFNLNNAFSIPKNE